MGVEKYFQNYIFLSKKTILDIILHFIMILLCIFMFEACFKAINFIYIVWYYIEFLEISLILNFLPRFSEDFLIEK